MRFPVGMPAASGAAATGGQGAGSVQGQAEIRRGAVYLGTWGFHQSSTLDRHLGGECEQISYSVLV